MPDINMPKVIIGHACYRSGMTPNFYMGMIGTFTNYPGEIGVYVKQDLSVAWAKNQIAEGFLASDAEYLFLVDTDVGVPPDALKKLMSHKKDIVGGLVWKRKPPFEPQILKSDGNGSYNPITDYPEGLIEVDAIGGACTLFSRKVFEVLDPPWFSDQELDKSEDVFFEEKLREKGIKFYADTTIKCTHQAEILITEDHFKASKIGLK